MPVQARQDKVQQKEIKVSINSQRKARFAIIGNHAEMAFRAQSALQKISDTGFVFYYEYSHETAARCLGNLRLPYKRG